MLYGINERFDKINFKTLYYINYDEYENLTLFSTSELRDKYYDRNKPVFSYFDALRFADKIKVDDFVLSNEKLMKDSALIELIILKKE